MSDPVLIKAVSELLPFADKDNVIEIVMRSANKRFKSFHKIALSDLQRSEEKELMKKALQIIQEGRQDIAKNLAAINKNTEILQGIAQLQNLGLVLNGLNLCATCAGFAVMYEKLDKMSAEINQKLGELQATVKQGHSVQTGYEFNKVLADHNDMLDCRKKQRPYTEAQMRDLVDREYNVLVLLISVLQNNLASDKKMILDSIFSLLAMLTVSLRYFDEEYYFNNHEVLGDSDIWHSSHTKWMSAYDMLSATWFVELLQDYGLFEAGFSTVETDAYFTVLIEQVSDLRQEVEDNQFLVVTVADPELLRTLHEVTTRSIRETIGTAIDMAFSGVDEAIAAEVREKALNQVAAV